MARSNRLVALGRQRIGACTLVLLVFACGRTGLQLPDDAPATPEAPISEPQSPVTHERPAPTPSVRDAAVPSIPVQPTTPAPTPDAGAAVPPMMGSMPLTPDDVTSFDPGGPLPDCRALATTDPAPRESRFLALRGSATFDELPAVNIVELGEDGPGPPHAVGASFIELPIGKWSDDGRFFGFTTASASNAHTAAGSGIVEVQPGAEPIATMFSGSFRGFAPGSSRFATVSSGRVRVLDAADLAAPAREVDVSGFARHAEWSDGGRYLALATDAQQLLIVDADAEVPEAVPVGPVGMIPSFPRWSPGGLRLAYALWDGHTASLILLDLVHPSREPVVLSEHLNRINDGLSHTAWLDSDRLLIDEWSGELSIVDVSRPRPRTEALGRFHNGFRLLGGNRCIAYHGACGAGDAEVACVLSLDAEGDRTPRVVYPSSRYWSNTWSPQGSPLVFVDTHSKLISQVLLDGGPYAPRVLSLQGYDRLEEAAYISSEPDPSWVFFPADSAVHLWNTHSDQVTTLESEGLNYGWSASFAPDGRFAATFARDPGFPPSGAPLMIQRLETSGPSASWPIEVFFSLTASVENEVAWQP